MRFLALAEVLVLHELSIKEFGGTLGVRDQGGLESAVFHPQNVVFYGGGDVNDCAAAYAFHVAEGQCFLDGNKRTAVASAFAHLDNNGIEVEISQREFYDMVVGIAERRFTKSDLAEYLRRNCRTK